MVRACQQTCPSANAPDHLFECSPVRQQYHSAFSDWANALVLRSSMQWGLFFLIITLILGAFFRGVSPSWVPYTVGLLVLFFLIGAAAGMLDKPSWCPHHAWVYDANHDSRISPEEYRRFQGIGFNSTSFCIVGGVSGDYLGVENGRTCGTGGTDESPSGCYYSFESLDTQFKLSDMLPTGSNKNGAGDGYLSADELWVGSCNLLRGMVQLPDMDPHLILTIFLPALLFESAAFGIDVRRPPHTSPAPPTCHARNRAAPLALVPVTSHLARVVSQMGLFKKQLYQIFTMAFPAMILASALTGLAIYAMVNGEWTFWVCWLIGVITSATDPVAVVALLKDLGAAKTLGTLIEGESLLNDGSAVVLYVWVRAAIGYDYATMAPPWMISNTAEVRYQGQVGVNFVVVVSQMLLFGVVYGFIFGYSTRFMLRFVYNDRFIEGSLVIGMSYLCFWSGELVVGTSAVIAVVVMGLYMNEHKSALSPEVLPFMHQFYEMVAHILNTVIFAIAGTKVGTLLGDGKLLEIFTNYSWRIIMIYPIVLCTRGIAILLFYPFLKRVGTGCTWQEAVVMWWGGLRGSVGLALALVVAHSEYDASQWGYGTHTMSGSGSLSVDCRDQPHVVLLMNLMVVVFTVVINGSTMAPLMRFLKLTSIPEDRRFQLNTAYLQMKNDSDTYFNKLKKNEKAHAGVDWDYVHNRIVKHYELFHDITDHERAAWMAVLCIERASYLAQFEDGMLSDSGFEALENFMATVTADATQAKTSALSDLYDKRFHELLSRLDKKHPSMSHKKLVYEVFVAYHNAQEEAKHVMKLFEESVHVQKEEKRRASMVSHRASLEPDGRQKSDLSISAKTTQDNKDEQELGFQALTLVQKEHDDNVEDMEKLFTKIEDSCVTKASQAELKLWKSQHALTMMLLHQRKLVEHMKHEGVLADLDAQPLVAECNKKLSALQLEPIKLQLIESTSSTYIRAATRRPRLPNSEEAASFDRMDTTEFAESNRDHEPGSPSKLSFYLKHGKTPKHTDGPSSHEPTEPEPAVGDRATFNLRASSEAGGSSDAVTDAAAPKQTIELHASAIEIVPA